MSTLITNMASSNRYIVHNPDTRKNTIRDYCQDASGYFETAVQGQTLQEKDIGYLAYRIVALPAAQQLASPVPREFKDPPQEHMCLDGLSSAMIEDKPSQCSFALDLYHTWVPDVYRGKGLAKELVVAALAYAK